MAKTLVEALEKITIKQLKEAGYFNDGKALNLIGLTFTSSKGNLGGKRFWFECICDSKASILYLDGSNYRCRKCLNLAYRSQNIKKSVRNDVMLSAFDALIEAQRIFSQITRPFYKNQPTEKFQKAERLYYKYLKISYALN